jgi:hypothetical protein
VSDWLDIVTIGSDKDTQYILQLNKSDGTDILTLQRTSLQETQLKMLKISIFFVVVVVAVLFVAGKHKHKVYCNAQFPQTYLAFLEIRVTAFH